jgi:hypothetical protein
VSGQKVPVARPSEAELKRSEVPIYRNPPGLNEHFGGERKEANDTLWTDTK